MKNKTLIQQLRQLTTGNLVIKGTFILTIAGISTRIIGFYNRIFLSNLIGATELGIYQLIFPLYMIAFAFTTFGNELALTKLISEYKNRNNPATVQAFFRLCFCTNLFLSITLSVIMYQNAGWLCTRILNAPACTPCLKILCIGMPFMAMKGCIHGYFLGLEKSSVHGISDFLEQIAKVFGLYLLATYFCQQANYNAAFAMWGIVIGEILAFLYSILTYIRHYIKEIKPCSQSAQPIYTQQICILFFKHSIPFTINKLALTILQGIESIMIPTALFHYYQNASSSLAHYGTFTGMAFPFIMFPSTITNSLSTMLLPAVSSANSALNKSYLSKLCEKSLHFCLLIGMFSTIAFYIFGTDIGLLFFQNKEAGIYVYQLSFLCPFIYLATTLASILNGLGYATYNLLFTAIATVIRISFIQFAIPKVGMTGYILGLFVSYLFLTFSSLHIIQKKIYFHLHFLESIFLPGCTFSILGACFYYVYQKAVHLRHLTDSIQILILITTILLYGLISLLPFLFGKSGIICKKDASKNSG